MKRKHRSVFQNETNAVEKLDSRMIERVARERLHHQSFAKIFLIQAQAEWKLRFQKQVSFRWRENSKAIEAYQEMDISEFEGINARQRWANWRTIPKNLDGLLPSKPLFALDLCCGIGHSTEVLAYYLPKGSRILGIEYNPDFVRQAQERQYLDRDRKKIPVSFVAQSVLETFRDTSGNQLQAGSVDLVNSCGAVGSHFDTAATENLAKEVARVLKPGGLATIDSGLPGTSARQLSRIFEANGFEMVHTARSCLLDPYKQVCFRRR